MGIIHGSLTFCNIVLHSDSYKCFTLARCVVQLTDFQSHLLIVFSPLTKTAIYFILLHSKWNMWNYHLSMSKTDDPNWMNTWTHSRERSHQSNCVAWLYRHWFLSDRTTSFSEGYTLSSRFQVLIQFRAERFLFRSLRMICSDIRVSLFQVARLIGMCLWHVISSLWIQK